MYVAVNLALLALVLLLGIVLAYEMAKHDLCFTTIKEGSAKAVMRGETFSHFIWAWAGHDLNDPRRLRFDYNHPAWEVLEFRDQPNRHFSPYAWWQVHWKFLARFFGIYWFGLSPFYRIYRYEFEWTEQTFGEDGQACPWHRREWTDFIFLKAFPYWNELREAEDKNNLAVNLDYLDRVEINNPYKALFTIDDWLNQGTADSNNRAKVYAGEHTFNEIKVEKEAGESGMSGLTRYISTINTNLLTSPSNVGAPMQYGMTLVGASLVNVELVRSEAAEALEAEELAKLQAKATIAAAEGEATAVRARAKGEADATRERAGGEADAIKKVYDQIAEYRTFGLAMRELDTLKEAANSPSTNIIWANDPLGGLGTWFKGINIPKQPPAQPPQEPTNQP